MKAHCLACHAATAPVIATRAEAVTHAAAIAESVSAGRMPTSGEIPADDKAILVAWGSQATPALALADAPVTYEGAIKAIVDTKCAWCHSATAAKNVRTTPYLTGYAAVSARANGSYKEMQKGAMPPRNVKPTLSATETALFKQWIDAGMPQGTPPKPIDPNKPLAYLDTVKGVLDANCVGCHKAGLTPPALDTYDAAVAAAAISRAAIEKKTMPPAGPLAADVIAGFGAWVQAKTPYSLDGTPPPSGPSPREPEADGAPSCPP